MATRPAAPIRRARSSHSFDGPAIYGCSPIHPLTFKPEFIDAFELGTKNTLLDGALTLNGDVFYYNYENYQISEIVDRTAINLNFDAHVKGAELEATWEPLPGLRFNFAGGWEDTAIAKGESAVDLMDRTAGDPRLDRRQAVHHSGIELHTSRVGRCRIHSIWDTQHQCGRSGRGQPTLWRRLKMAEDGISEDQEMAKAQGADIYFGDAAHIRSDHHAGRTWGKKGETPVIVTTGARHAMSLLSAITSKGRMRFMIKEKGGVNSDVFIEFLNGCWLVQSADFPDCRSRPGASVEKDQGLCRNAWRQAEAVFPSSLLAGSQS